MKRIIRNLCVAATVLCVDKTGTLTYGEPKLTKQIIAADFTQYSDTTP